MRTVHPHHPAADKNTRHSPAGKTKISVSYSDDDSAATIAGLMQVAVDAVEGFSAEVVSGSQVHIENLTLRKDLR